MFDYARRMQLAASDVGRRVGLKAAAGALGAVAAGFLVAALWTLFDSVLDWGPLWASVAVAVLFLVVAAVLWGMSKTVKHPVPSTDELKREVEARVSLATDAAMDRAKLKAREVMDVAENKVHGLIDTASFKASSLVDTAGAKVQGLSRSIADEADARLDVVRQPVSEMADLVRDVKDSRAGPAVGVIGAFVVGLALASRLRPADRWEDDWDDPYDDDQY